MLGTFMGGNNFCFLIIQLALLLNVFCNIPTVYNIIPQIQWSMSGRLTRKSHLTHKIIPQINWPRSEGLIMISHLTQCCRQLASRCRCCRSHPAYLPNSSNYRCCCHDLKNMITKYAMFQPMLLKLPGIRAV